MCAIKDGAVSEDGQQVCVNQTINVFGGVRDNQEPREVCVRAWCACVGLVAIIELRVLRCGAMKTIRGGKSDRNGLRVKKMS